MVYYLIDMKGLHKKYIFLLLLLAFFAFLIWYLKNNNILFSNSINLEKEAQIISEDVSSSKLSVATGIIVFSLCVMGISYISIRKIFVSGNKKIANATKTNINTFNPNLNDPVELQNAIVVSDFGVFDAFTAYRAEEMIKASGLAKNDTEAKVIFIGGTTLAWIGMSTLLFFSYGSAGVTTIFSQFKNILQASLGKQISENSVKKLPKKIYGIISRMRERSINLGMKKGLECLKQTGFVKNTGLPRKFAKAAVGVGTRSLYFAKIGVKKPYALVVEPCFRFCSRFLIAALDGWVIIIRSIAK